jgi:AraC family transcriptional regulator, glycine betaine-responsive activator
MFESLRGSRPLRAAFLLIPRFSLMSFASAVEPLRAANRLSGQALYEWRFVTTDGRPVEASNGMAVLPHASIETVEPCPLIVVCAGLDAQAFDDRRPLGWLRRRALEGAIVGSVSTGSYILAKAGLLHGHRCTTHWENLAGFREDWPELEVTDQLFEVDHNRFTCSGGTAALDLMLQLIALQHGPELGAGVSEQFLHPHLRSAADDQRMALGERLQASHPRLLAAILAMEKHLEEPLAGKQIAREVGLSKRQVERLSAAIWAAPSRATTWSCASIGRSSWSPRPRCRSWRSRSPAASSRPPISRAAIADALAARRATSGRRRG